MILLPHLLWCLLDDAEHPRPQYAFCHLCAQVKTLHRQGSIFFRNADFVKALQCYSDALEIDEHSVESLEGRAAVHLELNQPAMAQRDVDRLLALNEATPQVRFSTCKLTCNQLEKTNTSYNQNQTMKRRPQLNEYDI